MAAVGTVTKMLIKTKDNLGNAYETNPNNKLLPFTSTQYKNIDSSARALIQLSQNNYDDTELITSVSVNNKVREEEG